MLIEVNKKVLDDKTYIIVLTKNGTELIPLGNFKDELVNPCKELKNTLEKPLTQIATIVKEKPVEVVNGYKNTMYQFCKIAAFQNLKDAMNFKGVEISDEELDKIYNFVYSVEEKECPEAFIPYLNKYTLIEPKTAESKEVEDE